MSSFDSSASEHETRVLNQSFCVDFFYISALKVDSKGRLYISVKCYDSDLRWLIYYLFIFFYVLLSVYLQNATVCLHKLECFTPQAAQAHVSSGW